MEGPSTEDEVPSEQVNDSEPLMKTVIMLSKTALMVDVCAVPVDIVYNR